MAIVSPLFDPGHDHHRRHHQSSSASEDSPIFRLRQVQLSFWIPQEWGPVPQAGNYNLEEYMNLFLWMEDQKLMGNDPFLALVAEEKNVENLKEAVKAQEKIETDEWFEDDDAEEESSDDEGGKYSFPISSMLQMVLNGMH